MKVGIVGATGQVGTVMRRILAERKFPVDELRLFASARSAGSTIEWQGQEITVEDASTADYTGLDIVLFSAGGATSKALAEKVAAQGAVVIDNSSAWRKDPEVPLVVSEVNPHAIKNRPKGIIANPNCTTMAAMPVLRPLHDEAGLDALVVTTYQAVSGSGSGRRRRAARPGAARSSPTPTSSPTTAARSTSPSRASTSAPSPSTCCRWPARSSTTAPSRPTRSRSSATSPARSWRSRSSRSPAPASASRSSPATRSRSTPASPARSAWSAPTSCSKGAPGVELSEIPTPLQAAGQDVSYVGRIRADETVENGLALFVSNDNLRKGAALNAVQIAELVAAELQGLTPART